MAEEEKARAELLALYEDAARNIETYKKRSIDILVYYTGILAFVFHQYLKSTADKKECINLEQWESLIRVLFISAIVCGIIIWNNYRLILSRRRRLGRIFNDNFSPTFRNARGKESAVNKGVIDLLFHYIQCAFPLIALTTVVSLLNTEFFVPHIIWVWFFIVLIHDDLFLERSGLHKC